MATIGYTTPGTAGMYGVANLGWTSHGVAASSGTAAKIHFSCGAVGADTNVKVCLYGPVDADGDPAGHALIAQAAGNASVSDDVSISLAGGTITAGQTYAFGILFASADTKVKYDAGSTGDAYMKTGLTYASEWQDPCVASWSGDNSHVSIWLEYTLAGGGTAVIAGSIARRRRG